MLADHDAVVTLNSKPLIKRPIHIGLTTIRTWAR